MNTFPAPELPLDDAELQRRREEIRRGLTRANTAAAVILLIVIALALAAVWQSWRANSKALEAQQANGRLQEQLYDWHLAQAHAARSSGEAGRRMRAAEAIAAAANFRPSLKLRNEAIGNLALFDVKEGTFSNHVAPEASCVAFDSTLERYAIGGERGHFRISRVADGKVEHTLEGMQLPIKFLRFSPNDQFLLVCHADGFRQLWDLGRETVIAKIKAMPGDFFESVAFGTDNSSAVMSERTEEGSVLHFFKLPSGEKEFSLSFSFQVRHMAFQPGGALLAIATNATVLLWDREAHQAGPQLEQTNLVTRVAWHPDGRRLITSARNGELRLWDVGNPTNRGSLFVGHTAEIVDLHFNHRGDLLVSGSADGSTRFWEVETGRLLLLVRQGMPLGFSGDDKWLAFQRPFGVGMWQMEPSPIYRAVHFAGPLAKSTMAMDIDPSGRFAVVCGWRQLYCLALEKPGRARALLPDRPLYSALFSSDGQSLYTTGPTGLQRWQVECSPSSQMPQLGEMKNVGQTDGSFVGELRITRGTNDHFATMGPERAVLLDSAHPETPTVIDTMPMALATAVSADGKWLARSGPRQPTVVRHLAGNAAEFFLSRAGGLVQFSPDNQWLVVGNANQLTAWRIENWDTPAWTLACEPVGEPFGQSTFSSDGKLLAIQQSFGLIQLVEPTTGAQIASFISPNPQHIQSLTLSADSHWLAALTLNRELQLWDLRQTRAELSKVNLDWAHNSPTFAVAPAVAKSEIQNPKSQFSPWLPMAGALLALGFGTYTLRYQRKLVRSYGQIERLVAQRNRQLEQTQAELVQSQKMKALGTLAAGIAHDFNNLLSVIRLANDFLRRGVKNDPDLTEETETIEQAVEQGKTVVHSMLGYSRSKTDEPQLLNVCELVEDTLGLLTQQFLSGTRLTVELDRNSPLVQLTRGRLQQILLNLLVNASEAMKGGGKLAITLRTLNQRPQAKFILAPREAPTYVELGVADSGPGIAPEILPRIFEPFFTTKTLGAQRGTGLGLSMIYTAAKEEGLGVSVDSELGKGASFSILIPTG